MNSNRNLMADSVTVRDYEISVIDKSVEPIVKKKMKDKKKNKKKDKRVKEEIKENEKRSKNVFD